MLAMDVVDTLRHRRLLVERELLSDKRDEKLLDRLREIYRSQGMEVTDEVLQAGVEALREERFSYRPPRKSLAVRLARLYVQRGKWGLRAAIALAVVMLVWLGYAFFVSGPAEQRLQAAGGRAQQRDRRHHRAHPDAGAGGEPDRGCAGRVCRRCAGGVPEGCGHQADRRQNRGFAGRYAD